MKRQAGGLARVAIIVVVTATVVAVALLASATPRVTTTVVSADTSTSTSYLTTTQVVVSNMTETLVVTQNRPYALVVNPNATVSGGAVSIPGCAVRGGCTSRADQSSTAMLILYDGIYYYVSNYTETGSYNIVYTVWYTNSTEYCVSPVVSWDPVCPNAVFIHENSVQTTSLQSSSSQSVSCTISGEGGPLFLQIATDLGVPIQGQQLKVVHMGPSVNNQYCGTVSLPQLTTNSTGWVEVPGGDGLPYAGSFAVSFVYSGHAYNTTALIYPVTTTYVIIYVPSGQISTTNCVFNDCPTYSSSMGMGSG